MSAPSRALCALVDDRDGFACIRCGRSLIVVSGSRHHRVRRRDGGHSASNLILVCGSGTTGCHAWMHAYPLAARALGYIIPATWVGLDTEVIPVFSRTRGWMQLKDDGAPVQVLEAVALELLATFGLAS